MQKQKQQSTPSPNEWMPAEYEAVRHCRLSSSQNIPTPHWHFPRMLARSPPNHRALGVISSSKSWQRRFSLSQAQSLLVRHIIPSRILHSFQSSKSQPPEWLHSTNFPVAFVTWGKEGRTEVNMDINQYHPPYRQPRPWLQQRPLSLYCVMILRRILKSWILKSWISKKSHLLSFPLSYPEPQPGEERSVETRVTSFLVDSRSTNNCFCSLFVFDNKLPTTTLHYTFDKKHESYQGTTHLRSSPGRGSSNDRFLRTAGRKWSWGGSWGESWGWSWRTGSRKKATSWASPFPTQNHNQEKSDQKKPK